MSLNVVVGFPETGPQSWPAEGHKHCMYKYKHAHKLTYTHRNEDMNTSTNYLAMSFLLRRWYGHAGPPLPDVTAHSCMPQDFAIFPAQTRITSATFHSFPKPLGELHSWALSWAVPYLPARLSPSPPLPLSLSVVTPKNRPYPSITLTSELKTVLQEKTVQLLVPSADSRET